MRVIQVDVIRTQPRQALVALSQNDLARQPALDAGVVEPHLRGDEERITVAASGDVAADARFTFTAGAGRAVPVCVHVGRVKEAAARRGIDIEQLERHLVVQSTTQVGRAIAQSTDLNARPPQRDGPHHGSSVQAPIEHRWPRMVGQSSPPRASECTAIATTDEHPARNSRRFWSPGSAALVATGSNAGTAARLLSAGTGPARRVSASRPSAAAAPANTPVGVAPSAIGAGAL